MTISELDLKDKTETFSDRSFQAFIEGLVEPSWAIDRRREAFAAFQALGMPSSREEEWRRTDIRAFKLERFAPASVTDSASVDEVQAVSAAGERLSERYATGIVRLDGRVVGGSSSSAGLPPGVLLLGLDEAIRTVPELVRRHLLTTAVDPRVDKFAALHAAFGNGGAFLYVPKGTRVEAPLYHLIGMSSARRFDASHTLVVLEEGAEATLVQETTSVDPARGEALHAGAVELIVGAGAKLRFVNIQNWNDATWHFSRERAVVATGGALQWTVGGLGSRLSKVNQEVSLEGRGARAQVNGVMFTTGKQHLAYFTRQDHAAADTSSDLLYKAGLMDRSRIVWKGMIRVEKGAQKTDAYQKNDNLVLSDEARSDSIPGLEIEADDVRCTHGATAGRVDDEMIFYARSRGIAKNEAIRLIVEGFFANVYDRISLEPVQETLRGAVAAKLMLDRSREGAAAGAPALERSR
jgi:Fe-S cluster assembly protein SufD